MMKKFLCMLCVLLLAVPALAELPADIQLLFNLAYINIGSRLFPVPAGERVGDGDPLARRPRGAAGGAAECS